MEVVLSGQITEVIKGEIIFYFIASSVFFLKRYYDL